MNQNAIYLVITADAFTPVNTLLDADRVRSFVVSTSHLIDVVVNETECRSIYNGSNVYTVGLQRFEQSRQFRPARNTLEHNTVFLRERSCGLTLLNCLFQVFCK